ncbi:MAG: riboflavin synthase subunit alpha [Pseudomonadales bacterium]|nr:riboflavin synthase subunit alpha [Pseudomonadales bacterium]
MFTGIVQGLGTVAAIEALAGLSRFTIELPAGTENDISLGASIALNGVCMTVTQFDGALVSFDAMDQTLRLTSLSDLKVGDQINVERSAKQGDEVGGHIVSGHVDGVAEIVAVDVSEHNQRVTYRLPASAMMYLFDKGFVSLDGCSLTIAALDKSQQTLSVSFIPETLRMTTHGFRQPGDRVNFEIDRQTQAIVDTVKNLLHDHPELLNQPSS